MESAHALWLSDDKQVLISLHVLLVRYSWCESGMSGLTVRLGIQESLVHSKVTRFNLFDSSRSSPRIVDYKSPLPLSLPLPLFTEDATYRYKYTKESIPISISKDQLSMIYVCAYGFESTGGIVVASDASGHEFKLCPSKWTRKKKREETVMS